MQCDLVSTAFASGVWAIEGFRFTAVGVIVLLMVIAMVAGATAQDDWEVFQPSAPREQPASAPSSGSAMPGTSEGGNLAVRIACGERVRPAAPEISAMVARIDQLWGLRFPVYETVAPEGPHAASGGCVFYNRLALGTLMTARLGAKDAQIADPLLWAIFAHEIGHQAHRDFDSSRAAVSDQTKELEADRFAGYTLEELDIPATSLTPFWNMTGDEFGAGPYAHGSSAMRTAAFKQGWRMAEWKRPEHSEPVRAASEEPVAPDDSSAAPQ